MSFIFFCFFFFIRDIGCPPQEGSGRLTIKGKTTHKVQNNRLSQRYPELQISTPPHFTHFCFPGYHPPVLPDAHSLLHILNRFPLSATPHIYPLRLSCFFLSMLHREVAAVPKMVLFYLWDVING